MKLDYKISSPSRANGDDLFKKIEKKKVINSLSMHESVTDEILAKIKDIPAGILENLGNNLAKRAVKLAREVDSELHGQKAFLRLSISPHGILHAKITVKHEIEEEIIHYYTERFPMFTVLLESKRGVFAGRKDHPVFVARVSLEDALEELEEKYPKDPLLEDLSDGDYQELWESFARSQIIKGKRPSKRILNLSNKWKQHKVTVMSSPTSKLVNFFKN
ncbi:MAG: DUF4130 domain-containing protein [Candidatus Hodarchaeales archaeon]